MILLGGPILGKLKNKIPFLNKNSHDDTGEIDIDELEEDEEYEDDSSEQSALERHFPFLSGILSKFKKKNSDDEEYDDESDDMDEFDLDGDTNTDLDADDLDDDDNTSDIDISELDDEEDDEDRPKRRITAKQLIYVFVILGMAYIFLAPDEVENPKPKAKAEISPKEMRRRANEKRKKRLAAKKKKAGKTSLIDKVKADVAAANVQGENRTKEMMDEVGSTKKENVFEDEGTAQNTKPAENNRPTSKPPVVAETPPPSSLPSPPPPRQEKPSEDMSKTDSNEDIFNDNSGDDIFGENSDNEKTEDITTKILEDLERKVKADKGTVEEVLKYVSPPNYDNIGRGLVYSCKGKHWACIDAASYLDCQKNHKYNTSKNQLKECFPVEVYHSIQDCTKAQIHNIDSVVKTGFCQDI